MSNFIFPDYFFLNLYRIFTLHSIRIVLKSEHRSLFSTIRI